MEIIEVLRQMFSTSEEDTLEWVYKVFAIVNGQMKSYTYWNTLAIVYKPLVPTEPNVGKIFCFNSANNAINFLGSHRATHDHEVWRCLAYNVTKAKDMPTGIFVPCSYDVQGVVDFWVNPEHWKPDRASGVVPKGTLFADMIIPVDKIGFRDRHSGKFYPKRKSH